jgi:hypothetical protein
VSLFDQAKEKLAAGAVDEACALFVESYRADAQVGTLLNTALCHERAGKLASAWAEFSTVASLAARAGQPKRAELARDHARRLEPQVSRVHLDVRERADGLTLSIDGESLAVNDVRGAGVPIDPGEHVVTAAAPGKKPWRGTLRVAAGAHLTSFEVPALEAAPPEAAPAVTSPRLAPAVEAPSGSPLRPFAWVAAAGAIGGLAVGGIGGGIALSARSEADRDCTGSVCRTPTALDANDRAHTWATVSTIGFVAAGVLAATAVVLFVVSAEPSHGPAVARWRSNGFVF